MLTLLTRALCWLAGRIDPDDLIVSDQHADL
jgi:hypothetical protein